MKNLLRKLLQLLILKVTCYKDIFTSQSLDEKKNLMINFKFQDFESIIKNQEHSIENILTTSDRKYLFLCKL